MRRNKPLRKQVLALRQARGRSQQELANRAGVSRAKMSVNEVTRISPPVATGLPLAHTLGCQLFFLRDPDDPRPPLGSADESFRGRPPTRTVCLYCKAEVRGPVWYYPCELLAPVALPNSRVWARSTRPVRRDKVTSPRVVPAGYAPAATLPANLSLRRTGFRLLVLPVSSRASVGLLTAGQLHLPGIHLGSSVAGDNNALAVRETDSPEHALQHLNRWQSDLALPVGTRFRQVSQALPSRQRWVGQEPGLGARQCLDEIRPLRPVPRLIANDHRGVILATQAGWEDVRIAPRISGEEAGRDFLEVRREIYDLCLRREDLANPRVTVFQRVLRSPEFRRLLADLPGYDTPRTGQIRHAS
jgi:putative molybdopterin biosynthesis protein